MAALTKPLLSLIAFTLTLFIMVNTSQYAELLKPIPLDTYQYPTNLHPSLINPVLATLDTLTLFSQLNVFISHLPEDRYYNSADGLAAATYFAEYLKNLITKNETNRYQMEIIHHEGWIQPSLVFRMNKTDKGRADDIDKTIVIGCHIDSINFKNLKKAPGVDDNLSGIVVVVQTIKEIMALVNDGDIELKNTIEFHFYAAEEIGSLGSIKVFEKYRTENREIVAMLQQDMTGYTETSIERGFGEHFGIITDYASNNLMTFTKSIIDKYCDIPYLETTCGKICSDHISALMHGYPSVYVLESKVDLSNPFIHSEEDIIERIDFNHMLQHLKLTLAFTLELAMSDDIVSVGKTEEASFRYMDYMILLMMHHTKRFVYTVLVFGGAVGSLYIIIDDMWISPKKKNDDEKSDTSSSSSKDGELITGRKKSNRKKN